MKILRAKTTNLADLLPDNVMSRLLKAGSVMSYEDGQIIQERGDDWRGLSIVRSGLAVAGNYGDDGSFLASALLRTGECYGEVTLFLDSDRTHGLWAQGRTEIIHIDEARFIELFETEPEISKALLKLTLLRNQELLEYMDTQRRLSVVARVARLLFSAADTASNEDVIECRHEDISVMIGVSRVSIGKALKKLEDDELIELAYGSITIPDLGKLRDRVSADDPLFVINN